MKSIFKHIVVTLLTLEAKLVLRRHKPRIIAVTGSVGKTTTKDAIYFALHAQRSVRRNQKSFNSEIGVPLTILGLQNQWGSALGWGAVLVVGLYRAFFSKEYPEWLILEAGVDAPGDMRKLCRWLAPDVTVLTRFPDTPVHVEQFPSPQAVIAEKRNLVRALATDGLLVVNYDDPKTRREEPREEQRKITFGLAQGADVRARLVKPLIQEGAVVGMQCSVSYGDAVAELHIHGVLGVQPVYAALAGIAVAVGTGMTLQEAIDGVAGAVHPPGRMRIIPGKNDTIVIDDSYNSSPAALEEALATLGRLKVRGHKIALLGDMLQLGEYTVKAHTEAGIHVAEVVDELVTVGVRARAIAKSARDAGMATERVHECSDAYKAADIVLERLTKGDVILVKGSESGIRLERAVKVLMAEPERAGELLVRQEEEWLKRK